MEHKEDGRRRFSLAAQFTVPLVNCLYFGGQLGEGPGIFTLPRRLFLDAEKSCFYRRMHQQTLLLVSLFEQLGQVFRRLNISATYRMDSFPERVLHNIRIPRCRIVKGEEYLGKCVAKWGYFYRVKVFLTLTEGGLPVEVEFLPGAAHDSRFL